MTILRDNDAKGNTKQWYMCNTWILGAMKFVKIWNFWKYHFWTTQGVYWYNIGEWPISPAERSSFAIPSAESLVGWIWTRNIYPITFSCLKLWNNFVFTVIINITVILIRFTWNSKRMSLSSLLVFLILNTRLTVRWFSGTPACASDRDTCAPSQG